MLEDLYSKYVPDLIAAMHESIYEGTRLSDKNYDKIHHSFPSCIVGQIRQKVGLPEFYASTEGEEKDNYCHLCVTYGTEFARAERYKDKKKYEKTLDLFKRHLNKWHGKEI